MAKIFFAYPYEWDSSMAEYGVAVRSIVRELHHECIIAKDIPTDLPILEHIKNLIEDSALAFFDITLLKPNVLIEFGIGYSADTKALLLVNETLHVTRTRPLMGPEKIAPLPTPSDLSPFIRYGYSDTSQLRARIKAAIETHLASETHAAKMKDRIKASMRKFGPINMSRIANETQIPIDDVRPILKALVATSEVARVGTGTGTKYQLPQK